MKTKLNIEKLQDHHLDLCRNHLDEIEFHQESFLFYEGHIPPIAFLVVTGMLFLVIKNKNIGVLNPGEIIGIRELLLNVPGKCSVMAQPKSKICVVDRSTINNVLSTDSHPLKNIFHDCLRRVDETTPKYKKAP